MSKSERQIYSLFLFHICLLKSSVCKPVSLSLSLSLFLSLSFSCSSLIISFYLCFYLRLFSVPICLFYLTSCFYFLLSNFSICLSTYRYLMWKQWRANFTVSLFSTPSSPPPPPTKGNFKLFCAKTDVNVVFA